MKYSEELSQRLGDVIRNTCNTIGCKDCDLKWGDECSATDLQSRIFDAEKEEKEGEKND